MDSPPMDLPGLETTVRALAVVLHAVVEAGRVNGRVVLAGLPAPARRLRGTVEQRHALVAEGPILLVVYRGIGVVPEEVVVAARMVVMAAGRTPPEQALAVVG